MYKNKLLIVLISMMIILTLGCVEQETNDDVIDTKTETSFVDFKVTDKVTEDFDNVYVTFSEIRLFNQTEENNSSIVAISTPTTVDLISLNLSQINASLGIAEIESGNYSKLWLNVTNCSGVLNSTGEQVNITVPSGWLKIQQLHLFNVTKGNHTILIDIDLENSIHTFHGGEEYKFIPVISKIEHRHEQKLQFKIHDKNQIKNMVGNRKPAIDLLINDTLVKNKITLEVNTTYIFNATGTIDLDEDSLTYTWDFGDGENATGPVVTHSYAENDTYQLWLTVTDGTAESTHHVTVKVGTPGKENKPGNGPN
ncbi:MAG: DUF4382 domain-containing protein [Thermoplasmatota archaeon]